MISSNVAYRFGTHFELNFKLASDAPPQWPGPARIRPAPCSVTGTDSEAHGHAGPGSPARRGRRRVAVTVRLVAVISLKSRFKLSKRKISDEQPPAVEAKWDARSM